MKQTAWDVVSAEYHENHFFPTDSITYGPWSPLEDELQVLGDVTGKLILEIGCGGGQNSLILAAQGARVIGLDSSERQLALARQQAQPYHSSLEFHQADAEDLSTWASNRYDLILSVYTLQYIEKIENCLQHLRRLLRPQGRLVFSLDHPIRSCFVDVEEDEMVVYPVRDYSDSSPIPIIFPQSQTRVPAYHRTVGQWVQLLQQAGLGLLQLHEPAVPTAIADEFWPLDSPLAPLRNLPHSAIFVATKQW